MKRTILSIAAAGLIGVAMVSGADAGSASTTTVSGAQAVVQAPAGTQPTEATTAEITRAVERSPLLGDVPSTGVVVDKIQVSNVDSAWGSALVAPRSSDVDPAQVVVHHTARGWVVSDLGTDQVGCQVLTSDVRHELGLWGHCAA